MTTPDLIRVILADDSDMFRRLWRRLIGMSGGEVIAEAGDGEEALQICREQRPDVLVTDLEIPKVDGLELIRQLRRADSDVFAVLCTSRRLEELGGDATNEIARMKVVYLGMENSDQLPDLLANLRGPEPTRLQAI